MRQFRGIIGRSYIPPKFAFGYGQSRWGYKTPEDFRTVLKEHRDAHVPLDMLYMDIDYMQDYKDFTVNGENFPDFPAFVAEMQRQHIHLVPIIDAGVKVEDGYPVYEEGVEKGYFCRNADGSLFTPAVWPGWTHFPDVLNPDARAWFGGQYRVLLDAGIDGFWNDMNEPAIFYSKQGLDDLAETYREALPEGSDMALLRVAQQGAWLAGSEKDYARFYHNVGGQMVRHDTVHNLYGYNMTRAAGRTPRRHLDRGQPFLVVAYSAELADAALAEHVRLFVRRRGHRRLWQRHHARPAAALAGTGRVCAADAQPLGHRHPPAGVLAV